MLLGAYRLGVYASIIRVAYDVRVTTAGHGLQATLAGGAGLPIRRAVLAVNVYTYYRIEPGEIPRTRSDRGSIAMEQMIALEQAQAIVLDHVRGLEPVAVACWQALGLPLAQDAVTISTFLPLRTAPWTDTRCAAPTLLLPRPPLP